ncbi:MAG: tetratricopeptide repeat protein [Myxococcales bacterium]|nr:tetratricopeptide repeat protein [Myxococcales bacterium]
MALALRIRVTWQGDVVEDVVHEGRSTVRVGAGSSATVVAPGETDRLVRFSRRRGGFRIHVPAGAAERIEFPGEDPIDGGAVSVGGGFERALGVGCGRLVIGGTDVDFEVLRLERDHAWLYLGAGLFGIAFLALFAGFGYRLVRQWGDGSSPRWGEAVALGADQAKFLRVTLDPTPPPAGASRLAAGTGATIRGVSDSLLVRRTAPMKVEQHRLAVKRVRTPRAKAVAIDTQEDGLVAFALSPLKPNVLPVVDVADDDEDDDSDDSDKADASQLIESGQQALLAAELRTAIDSLTAAEKTDTLDYDNLNWIGLAHYFLGENQQAEERWNAALAMDPARPDAVNNLGGVARRRGDIPGEMEAYWKALALRPGDCHALNSMSLAQAKQGQFEAALGTLAQSDVSCGGGYAYTFIQRAGILSLQGKTAEAMVELERGLAKVDTLIPIKEYEVEADLLLDSAFAPLRKLPAFEILTARYLPRAVKSREAILSSVASPAHAAAGLPRQVNVAIFD